MGVSNSWKNWRSIFVVVMASVAVLKRRKLSRLSLRLAALDTRMESCYDFCCCSLIGLMDFSGVIFLHFLLRGYFSFA